MKLILPKGTTDASVVVFIADSTVTTGAGKTGLTYNSSSLTCYYVRPGGSATQLSLVTQTVTGAHSDGGFVEISSTNMPGLYRLDLSDAIVASGAESAIVMLKGATGMAPCVLEIQLANAAVGALTTTERTSLADALLNRETSNVEGTVVPKSLGGAVMKLVHRVRDNGSGSLQVYKSNGTDVAYSQVISSTDGSLAPIKDLAGGG